MTETLVITDLDGSFWGRELRCHPSTLAAVAELERRGVPLLVATGRRAASARKGLAQNGLTRDRSNLPAVLLNGALGVDMVTEARFHTHPFSATDARHVVERLAAVELSPIIYTDDGMVCSAPDATTHPDHRRGFGADHRPEPPSVTAATSTILSFSMLGLARPQLEPVLEALNDVRADVLLYEDHLYRAWSVHIQPAEITKWNGIQAYLGHAGMSPQRIVAIGDGTNDLEMLANADVALGVTGGHVEVFEVVDEVVPHPDDGGWQAILDHLQ